MHPPGTVAAARREAARVENAIRGMDDATVGELGGLNGCLRRLVDRNLSVHRDQIEKTGMRALGRGARGKFWRGVGIGLKTWLFARGRARRRRS